jgi:F-type H+-transporting ATPase subunit c
MDLMVALVALAQDTASTAFNFGLNQAGAALGAGLAIVGGGLGIGKLAASAMESISRQPEAAGDIRGGMILAAALIEGVTLLALITCILAIVL